MADLQDHQFELDGFVFGFGAGLEVDQEGFDTGTAEWQTQDSTGYGSGATKYGRDVLQGPTWAWEAFTNGASEAEALAILGAAGKAWRIREKRSTPGEFSTLRYAVAGRTRRIYGRPRRFSAPPNNKILGGMVPVVVDFKAADFLHYDDIEMRVPLDTAPSRAGGLVGPLVGPLTTLVEAEPREGSVVVDGDEDTPLIATFYGPSSNAWLAVNGVRVCEINGAIAYDQQVEVDARPWVNTIRRDGAAVPGLLSRRTFLDQMRLSPGPVLLEYGAIDETGTSRVEVRWRSAWSTL